MVRCSGLLIGDDFVRMLEEISGGDSTITVALILGIFAVAHSGLASLRPKVSNPVYVGADGRLNVKKDARAMTYVTSSSIGCATPCRFVGKLVFCGINSGRSRDC